MNSPSLSHQLKVVSWLKMFYEKRGIVCLWVLTQVFLGGFDITLNWNSLNVQCQWDSIHFLWLKLNNANGSVNAAQREATVQRCGHRNIFCFKRSDIWLRKSYTQWMAFGISVAESWPLIVLFLEQQLVGGKPNRLFTCQCRMRWIGRSGTRYLWTSRES